MRYERGGHRSIEFNIKYEIDDRHCIRNAV